VHKPLIEPSIHLKYMLTAAPPENRDEVRVYELYIPQYGCCTLAQETCMDQDLVPFMKDILNKVKNDPRYLENIEYGEPRSGHPEGKVKAHIAELEENLERLASRISSEQYWKLQFLIHVHDTFKADALPDSPIVSPMSHASLAKKFASEFTEDADLLNMLQFHDVNFSLWKQFAATGSYDVDRFTALLDLIVDWDLFLIFLIVDGCTKGKDPKKLVWFIREVKSRKQTVIDETWILQSNL